MSNSCESKEDCGPKSNTTGGGSDCCDMPEKLLCLADEAWREALKEKMKEHILKNSSEHLDKRRCRGLMSAPVQVALLRRIKLPQKRQRTPRKQSLGYLVA